MKNRNRTAEECRLLAASNDPVSRGFAAVDKNCPDDVMIQLANDPDYLVRCYVARSQRCPNVCVDALSNDAHRKVRFCLAASGRMLDKLSKDNHREVRYAVARIAPSCLVDDLAMDNDWLVRLGAAENTNLSHNIRCKLLNDRDRRVRIRANNPCGDYLDLMENGVPISGFVDDEE